MRSEDYKNEENRFLSIRKGVLRDIAVREPHIQKITPEDTGRKSH